MSQQIQISGGAKVRALEGVITGTSGVLSSVPLGAANGVATLDSGGKVPVSQLPSSVVTYLGTWNAATNTPTLVNGTGDAGDMYLCNVAGTVNFGAGPVVFVVGDWVLYGSGTWQKSSGQNGTVTSVGASITGSAIGITGSPITTAGTLAFAFAGTNLEYVNGAGNLTTFPILTGYVPYTGATANVDLGVFDLTADLITGATGSFASSGGSDTFAINHSSGSGIALNITKGGNGEGLYINKTSGTGNAATIVGTLEATTLVKSGGTSSQFLKADGTVDSNTYALDSSVVHNTGNETVGGTKTFSDATKNNGGIFLQNASSNSLAGYMNLGGLTNGVKFTSGGGVSNTFTLPSATGYDYTFPNGTGTIALTSNLSSYVPYTGAIANVDLGLYEISAQNAFLNGVSGINGGNLFLRQDIDFGQSAGYTTLYSSGKNLGFVSYVGSFTYNALFSLNSLTNNTARIYTLPNATGTIALTSDLTDYVTLSTAQTISGTKTFTSFTKNDFGVLLNASGNYTAASGYNGFGGISNGIRVVIGQTAIHDLVFSASTNYTYTFPSATGTIALVGGSGVGTVTSVAALTIGTTGTDLSSSVANSTTTPVITLNVPTASATNRGALSAADWTTFNNKQSALTNPVTGTGTAGYVPKWTSGSAIGNSILQDSGTRLTMTSGDGFQISTGSSDTVGAGSFIALTNVGATNWQLQQMNAAYGLDWWTLASGGGWERRMVLTNPGNLIVGTTNTSTGHRLTVYSATETAQFRAAGAAPAIAFTNTDTNTNSYVGYLGMATAVNNFITGAAAGDFVLHNYSGGPILFGINNSEKVRIASSGIATFKGSGNRPVIIDSNVNIKSDTGGWSMQHGFIGSSGTARGGFGAFGNADSLSYYFVGIYGAEKLTIDYTSGLASFAGAITATGNITGAYIFGSYFNASAGNSENPTIGQIWTQSTGDNYLRKSTPAHFRSQVTDAYYLTNNTDSEQTVGGKIYYFNSGAARMNADPRWNESGYDGDLGCLHIWAWTAAGVPYGRAGIALFSDTAYQYLTTKSGTTGLFVNNSLILTASNYNSYAPSLTGSGASGTWGISITGSAALLNGISSTQIFNNMGNSHGTYTDFNSVGDFGFRYLVDTTNGPNTGSSQYYGFTLGLGNQYAYGTYGMQFAIPRYLAVDKYISFRTQEAGAWQAWSKIYAGYADTAGDAGTVDGFSASQSTIANGIVVRDVNGYIFGNYLNMTDDGNPGSGTAITSFITKQGDNYYRSVSPTNAMVSIRGVASGTWGINVTGSAGSTSYLSALGSYVWNASTPATSYFLGITSSFVSSAEGWIDYGSLMTVMTYPGGGGTLQLYTPYSTVYGGSRLVYRSSDYNTGTWTGWKYLLNNSSDPYAYNMNQYVRTSDSPTFNTLYAADSIRFNQDVSVDNTFGIYFASSRSVAYGIYRASGAWTNPYPDLRIAMHTGIQMGANASYGGMRFYSDYDMSTEVFSVNNGDANVRVNNRLSVGTTTTTNQNLTVYSATGAGQVRIGGAAPTIYFTNVLTDPATYVGLLGLATSSNNFFTGTAAGDFVMYNSSSGYNLFVVNYSGGVYLTSGATSWTANSDIRLKNINSHIENAVEKLSTLQTINFSYKDDKFKKQNLGLIAQEVEKIFPELIDKNNDGMLGVRYTELVPVLIKAIQELKLEIETLKNK